MHRGSFLDHVNNLSEGRRLSMYELTLKFSHKDLKDEKNEISCHLRYYLKVCPKNFYRVLYLDC